MIDFLVKENQCIAPVSLPETVEERLVCWRGFINQRPAKPIHSDYLALEDSFLQEYHALHRSVSITDCQPTAIPQIVTYHGDITLLAADAIVNAANSDMVGCLIPNHKCIDNAIHTFAGYRLRLQCHKLMTEQGHKEAIGQAKITPAYHLPAQHVIHTVGPMIAPQQKVSAIRADLLKRSYLSCLTLAQEHSIQTLAFCGISTGEFGFPKKEAADIAVSTVKTWLQTHPSAPVIIFNTFTEEDKHYYQYLLETGDEV